MKAALLVSPCFLLYPKAVQHCAHQNINLALPCTAVPKATVTDQLALFVCTKSWHLQGTLLLAYTQGCASCSMQVTLQTYGIITPIVSGVNFNVRIRLESSEGHAGFYCNPSWGGQPDESSTIAQPKNAVWYTGVIASVPLPSCK